MRVTPPQIRLSPKSVVIALVKKTIAEEAVQIVRRIRDVVFEEDITPDDNMDNAAQFLTFFFDLTPDPAIPGATGHPLRLQSQRR